MRCEFLTHIKTNLCWFNLTYFRKRFDEKKNKNSIINCILNKRNIKKKHKKNPEGNQMPPVNNFDDYSPWADSTVLHG